MKAAPPTRTDVIALIRRYALASNRMKGISRITRSGSTPAAPSTGDLWVDTSGEAPALKCYNGSTWDTL
jgi:hypothetical protein